MKATRTIPAESDLEIALPSSASDYYALASSTMTRSASDIYCVEHGYITVDYSQNWQYKFCVHDADGNWIDNIRQVHQLPLSDHIVQLDTDVALIDDKFTKFNVCHFLLDKLYRVGEFQGLDVDSYVVFDANAYVQEVMSILDLDITPLDPGEQEVISFRFSKLYFSTSSFKYIHPCENFKSQGLQVLDQLKQRCTIESAAPTKPRRIFIDRSRAPARNIINIGEFHNLLEQYGFETIALEALSFRDQALAFNNVETVLGVHGAGLTNLIFNSNPNAAMLEILPPLCATADYWKLAGACGIHYDAFIADDPEDARPDYSNWEHQPAKYNRRNVHIDIARFEAFLTLNLPSAEHSRTASAA